MKLLGRIAFALAVMFTSVGATCQNGPTDRAERTTHLDAGNAIGQHHCELCL